MIYFLKPAQLYSNHMNRNQPLGELKTTEKEQPLDTVSQIVWDQSSNSQPRFLTASWDGYVRFYGISNDQLGGKVTKLWEMFLQHPVLCLDYDHNGIAFAGLASGEIVAVQCQNSQSTTLGNHAAPICGLYWIREMNILMSLGFDNLIKFWKLDCKPVFQAEFKLPCKTATCSFSFPYLLLGSIETTVAFINLSKLPNLIIPKAENYKKIEIQRFSKFNCCRVQARCNMAVLGTVDGRAAIMSFKELNNGDFEVTSIVSRTQKKTVVGKYMYGQVNAIDIGLSNQDFFIAIGGSDDLGFYNHYKKTKVKVIVQSSINQTNSTTAISISPNHQYIAYAVGSDWLRGIYDTELPKRPKVAVMRLSEKDVQDFTGR